MEFRKIYKRIVDRLPEASAIEVESELNNCLTDLGLELIRNIKTNLHKNGSFTSLYAAIGSVTITDGGTGYSNCYVTFTGGVGVSDAVGKVTVGGGGVVASIVLNSGGLYTTLPTGIVLSDAGNGDFVGAIVMDTDLAVYSETHGLLASADVVISGSSPDIDETYTIVSVSENHFWITATWTATGTGSWTSMPETATFTLDDDVISVEKVFLSGYEISNRITREEIELAIYSSKLDGVYISPERQVIFPSALSSSDTAFLVVRKLFAEYEELDGDDIISIPDHYLNAVVYFILRELYLYSKYLDGDLHMIYDDKYRSAALQIIATKTDVQKNNRVNIGPYDLGYDSNYGDFVMERRDN